LSNKKHSFTDSNGRRWTACSECERGGNGNGDEKCSYGWNIERFNGSGCFSGTEIEKGAQMKKIEIQWNPVTKPPKGNGYVLLAITHQNIPMVLMGFCRIRKGEAPEFKEEVYHGSGVAITHWAALPPHPDETKEDHNATQTS
jgi:hypothetical protein